MIKTLLVDDEPKALKALENKLITYCEEISIIGKATSTQEAFDKIITLQPQLVFLDIAMPEESGFDLLKRLPSLDFEIIFVTGFDEYAIEAIQFCAIGYVVKPIEAGDLKTAVDNAQQRISSKAENQLNKQLLTNLAKPFDANNRIAIPMFDGIEFVRVTDIIRCEAMERCTQIIIADQKKIVSSHHLGHFKNMLANYDFYQTHRSHIVNLAHLERYSKEGLITMSDESQIPLSRRNREGLLTKFK